MCLCKLATLQLGATFQLLLTTCHQDEMSLLHLILFFRGMLHISKFWDACSKAEEVCWKLICVLETIEIFDSVFYLIVRTNNLYQIDTLKSKFSQESRDKHCNLFIVLIWFPCSDFACVCDLLPSTTESLKAIINYWLPIPSFSANPHCPNPSWVDLAYLGRENLFTRAPTAQFSTT